MDLFKNRIQPTIVHLGDYANSAIANKYFLNYNVVQIDWFANNSIVMEDGSGVIVLESADDNNPLTSLSHDLMDVMSDGNYNGKTALDIPRIYFVISDKFISNTGEAITPSVINSFITTLLSLSDNCIEHDLPDTTTYITDFILNGDTYDGITLLPGVDYFINETFANYLINVDLGLEYPELVQKDTDFYNKIQSINDITIPNYLDSESNIQLPWIPLTTTEENNTDLALYYNINEIGTLINTYDVNNLYAAFCQIILHKSTLSILASDFQNIKYEKVLEYFANGKTDAATTNISLILGSQYNVNVNTASSLCGCGNKPGINSIDSCGNIYASAMDEHLKEMLGNTQFYLDWFYTDNEPNTELVKYLKLLLKAFTDEGFDLSFDSVNSLYCKCPSDLNNLKSKNNYDIINKYDNVLNYVTSKSLCCNINKTKLYGSQFGELLPKLQF